MVNNRDKTHCIRGHEFTVENTYRHGHQRSCRTCNRETKRRHKSRALAMLKEERREASLVRLDGFTDLQRAYLAGLIDGEGCITAVMRSPWGRSGPNCTVLLSIQMATAEPLATVCEWLGVGMPKWQKHQSPNARPYCKLTLHGVLMAKVLKACRPYLLLKQEQADIAMAMEALRAEYGGRRGPSVRLPDHLLASLDPMTARLHELNRRGIQAMVT